MERPLAPASDWLEDLRRQTGRAGWWKLTGEPIRRRLKGNIQFGWAWEEVENTSTGHSISQR